ncbi:MAG: hypothetical protein LC792_01605 [Actinobacteria bacterium]|nr:hypothetical protein [Actinomycetota bacterium]
MKARLTGVERSALAIAALALVGFGAHGFAQHEPSTVGYLFSVLVVAGGVAGFRRDPLPGWLALALAGLAIGHLAGGLVTVGGDVLYNAHPPLHIFQYDHVFHASASGIAAVVVWRYLSPQLTSAAGAILVACLGGLGIGAINELIEFLATLAHHGSHVGGYRNTGWDLLSNTVGTAAAMLTVPLWGRRRGPA